MDAATAPPSAPAAASDIDSDKQQRQQRRAAPARSAPSSGADVVVVASLAVRLRANGVQNPRINATRALKHLRPEETNFRIELYEEHYRRQGFGPGFLIRMLEVDEWLAPEGYRRPDEIAAEEERWQKALGESGRKAQEQIEASAAADAELVRRWDEMSDSECGSRFLDALEGLPAFYRSLPDGNVTRDRAVYDRIFVRMAEELGVTWAGTAGHGPGTKDRP